MDINDLYAELGKVTRIDEKAFWEANCARRQQEWEDLKARHEQEKNQEDTAREKRHKRATILREAIRLITEEGMDPLQAKITACGVQD